MEAYPISCPQKILYPTFSDPGMLHHSCSIRGLTLKIISGCNSPTRDIVACPDRRIVARDNFKGMG